MLRPRETPTRERKSLDGLWRFALDPDGRGRERGLVERPARRRARDPGPGELQRRLRRRRGCTTTSATSGTRPSVRVPARWAGERIVLRFDAATHRAVVWVDDDAGRRARGRLHAVRGRRHRRSSSRAPRSGSPPSSTTSSPGSRSRRATSRRRRTAARQQLLPRLLQLRRPAPDGLALHHAAVATSTTSPSSPASTARPGTVRYEVEAGGGDGSRCASCCATPRAPRSPRATGALGRADRRRTSTRGGRARATSTTSTVELRGDGRRSVDAYSLPVGIRTVRGRRRRAS